jgi:hypothetical protein
MSKYYFDETDSLVEVIREICNEGAPDEKIIEVISDALRASPRSSYFGKLVSEVADVHVQSALELQEYQIRADIEAQLEAEYDLKSEELHKQYETHAIYDLIEHRFLTEQRFRDRVLNRIRHDLIKRNEMGEVPEIFNRALAKCDKEVIISMLLEQCSNELIERFHKEIIERLIKEREHEFKEEIIAKLKNDVNYMKNLKNDFLDDVARRLFD